MTTEQIGQLSINTILTLSMDAVQEANSGHPGTPMVLAPLIYALWSRVTRFYSQNPIWSNPDRFVLSNGHASMLSWSVPHLTRTQGVNADYEVVGQPFVSLDDIRRYRQLPTLFVFTHDAMGDGEEDPADQPAEQLISLRAISGLITLRPGSSPASRSKE